MEINKFIITTFKRRLLIEKYRIHVFINSGVYTLEYDMTYLTSYNDSPTCTSAVFTEKSNRGPINIPIEIKSSDDFLEAFGNVNP